MNFDFIYNQ